MSVASDLAYAYLAIPVTNLGIPFSSPKMAFGPTAPNSAAAPALAWRSLLAQKVAAARARR
jgi:hypothetical protein